MRRGELLALRWQDVNFAGATVRVERTVEKTVKLGYRFKSPKTKHGRRIISLPPTAVVDLREHRKQQLELRMALGMGKPDPDALVFCRHDGGNLVPSSVTRSWHQAVKGRWKFHALRHTHASALIADGLDPVLIASRLGHSSPMVTMQVYAHLFRKRKIDTTAADAIEKLLGANRVPKPGSGH
jgi:integrase